MHRNQSVANMKFFADTRTQRNTAFLVLLVWLFALASGVANACFLEAPAGPHAHPVASAGHHDDSNNAKESCLKVCADGTQTVPKVYSCVDHTDPGPASLFTTLWAEAMDVVAAPRRMDALAIPIVGPPLRVRYSRLVL